nr:MAG TPA: regulatory protein [Caudoviricetes sp.]
MKLNWILLEAKTKEHGLTNEDVANALNIAPTTYYRKKRGETDFYREEIQKIRKILELSSSDVDAIFFDR